jgi:outer membrane protein OmpA-like peptidoglycan-associated protein
MKHLIAISTGLILLASCGSVVRETPSSYMVFFQKDDAQLSSDARAVVDQAAVDVRGTHPDKVMIAGGNAADTNLKLAEPRLLAVRQALIADGVSDQTIFRSAITEAGESVGATGDQRVEITLIAKMPS